MSYLCEECDSTDVEVKAWVKPNERIVVESEDFELVEECWCLNCEETRGIKYD